MLMKESVILIVILVSVIPDGASGHEVEDPGFHISTGCYIDETKLSSIIRSRYHLSQAKCTWKCGRYPGCARALYVGTHDYCHLYPCEVLDAFFIKNEESTFEHSSTSEENTSEDYVTSEESTSEDYSTSEESTSEDYSTSEESTSEDYSTSEESTSEDYSTSEEGTSEDYSTSEESTSEDYSTSEESTSEDYSTSEESTSEDYSTSEESTSEDYSTSEESTSEDYSTSEESTSEDYSTSEESTSEDHSTSEVSTSEDYSTSAEKCQDACARNPECVTYSFDDLNIFCKPLCILLNFDAENLAECGKSSNQVVGVATHRLYK